MEIKEFPINTQIGIFNSENDLELWLNSSKYSPIDYSLIRHAPFIYNSFVSEVLIRYQYFKTYNIPSFGKTFEELPGWWIKTINFIESLMPDIQKQLQILKGKNASN